MPAALHKPHQDHITAKGTNSITNYSLMHQFIPLTQALKNFRCKDGSGERFGKKTGKCLAWQLTKVRKEEERVVSKSRPAAMNISSSAATSSSSASSPLASESPGMPNASERPDRRMGVAPSSIDFSSAMEPGTTNGNKLRENSLPKTTKLGGNTLHTGPILQLTRKVKRIRQRHGITISTYRRTHRTTWKPSSLWSGISTVDNLAIL